SSAGQLTSRTPLERGGVRREFAEAGGLGPRLRLPPRGRRRHDPVHPQIDHELAVVVADLVQRALPERGAGDRAVAERELHGAEGNEGTAAATTAKNTTHA